MLGDWFARNKVAHLLEKSDDGVRSSFLSQIPNSRLRVKVLMSRKRLMELIDQVDKSKGTSELGKLILQDCLEGKLRASVVGLVIPITQLGLNAIKEELSE